MLASLEAESRAQTRAAYVSGVRACAGSFLVTCLVSGLVAWSSYTPAADRAPALALYVPPAGLRPPQTMPNIMMHHGNPLEHGNPLDGDVAAEQNPAQVSEDKAQSPRSPKAQMPEAPAEPVASPAFMMPMQSPGAQMPYAAPVVMMPSQETQTGPQMFAGFFWGLASSFAIGFTIMAKRMYDEHSLKGAAGDPELGRLPGRAGVPTMYDISAYDDIWGLDAKLEVYNNWDPEKPRDYNNFNPFERNDEAQQCDKNGCFPGQDGGYQPPNRPDVSWDLMQEHNKIMDDLKTQDRFNLKGKPGNWKKGWADNLGPTP